MVLIAIIIAIIGCAIIIEKMEYSNNEKEQQQQYRSMYEDEANYAKSYSENVSKNNSSGVKLSFSEVKDNVPDGYERYVEVTFDNYYRVYTYIAPRKISLKKGQRVLIYTQDGRKYVTIHNEPYITKRKTDKNYKVLDVAE